MKLQIKIFIFLALMLILPLALSEERNIRFYHPIGENLTFFEKCRVDGGICDTSYTCNASVLSSDQNLIVNNENMTRGDIYYLLNLNDSITTPNGIYEATVDCTNTTFSGSNTFYYSITPNGSPPIDEGQSIMALIGMALLIIISLYLGYLGMKSTNGIVSLGLVSFSIIVMVFSIGMIVNFFELSFGTFGTFIENYSSVYIALMILGGTALIGLIVWLVVFALRLYWKDKGIVEDAFRRI